MYTDPKHSQTVPRLISTLSPSFTLTLSRAIIPFRFPLQSGPRGLSGLVHMHCMDTGWEPFACSYSFPRACSTDPEYYATRTSLAVMAKLYLPGRTHSLTPWQGDMSHIKKLVSGLCVSTQSTQSRHNEFHQDMAFSSMGTTVQDKPRYHLFISMSLNNSSSADTVPHTAPFQCSIPACTGVGGQCSAMHTSGVAWKKQWVETCQHP